MNPSVLVVAILIARFVWWVVRETQGAKEQPAPPSIEDEKLLPQWLPLVLWIFLGPMVWVGIGLTLVGQPWLLPIALAFLLVLLPWPIARGVLVPLGKPLLAYHLAALSTVVWRRDRWGGAMVAGAWAVLRQPEPSLDDVDWLESRVDADDTITPSIVLAQGLLCAARGDDAGAERWIAAVEDFDPRVIPFAARRLARDWRVTHAAANGYWGRVEALADEPFPRSWATRFLGAVAKRLLDRPDAPSNAALWFAWALSRGHGQTIDLLNLALRARPRRKVANPAPAARPAPPDLLGRAIEGHVTLLEGDKPTRDGLVEVAGAWDALFADGRFDERLLARAEALGAHKGAEARQRLAREIEEDLAALVRLGEIPVAGLDSSPTLAAAARAVRDDLLAEIELSGAALARRIEAKRELPPLDELREFLALRDAWERAVRLGGDDLRRLAFRRVHDPVCSLAVWLFNTRGQRPLGNALFRWLLMEALAVGDQPSIQLQGKNTGCGFA